MIDKLFKSSKRLKDWAKNQDSTEFFVDGDHSCESVKKELSTILQNVPDTAVLLHDTFYQSEDSKYNIGPFKAVKEVLGNYKEYELISTNMGLPGMSLVYKK
ncbi:MAG TPA: hypothetical protein VN026_09475 [Bacteroidia bacterium]|jgi:hypothetical protein|nr:hypothetical protein [Bacteroidia bacterium]